MVNRKSWSGQELLSKYFVHVNISLNFKKDVHLLETDTKGRHSLSLTLLLNGQVADQST